MIKSVVSGLVAGLVAAVSFSAIVGTAGYAVFNQVKEGVKEAQTVNSVRLAPTVMVSPVVVAPKKVVATAEFKLCADLDKAGAKIADKLDFADTAKFTAYKKAVASNCTWHQSQVDASLSRYVAKNTSASAVIKEVPNLVAKESEDESTKMTGELWEIGSGRANHTSQEIEVERQVHQELRDDCPTCRQGITPDGYDNGTGEFVGK